MGFTAMTVLAILGVYVGGLGYHIYDMTAYRINMCYLVCHFSTLCKLEYFTTTVVWYKQRTIP